ncbi:hypothetical protein [uncultured Jatrophihabitans sp.]|uniref:hypothetical protein n=1 Tax=uncultured Jatrophihabitans sp. TaxID=1610747 RepID=UPI0035CB562B
MRLAALTVIAAMGAACTSSQSRSSSATSVAPSGSSASATPTLRPVPSTAVPAPQQGNLRSDVPSRAVRTLAPVPLSSAASFNNSVSAKLQGVRRTQVTARLPGEISGAALSVTVSFTNRARSAVSMVNVVVNVTDGAGVPQVLVESASTRVNGKLSPGSSKSGTYLFSLSKGFDNPATVGVSYSTAAPVILFVGKV